MGASGNEVAKELHNFMKQNPLFDIDMGDLILDTPQTRVLFNSNLSVEEFKEKWLELKEQIAQGKEAMNANSASNTTLANPQSEEKKTFTPIESESSRETYKDLSDINNLELTKIEQVKDMLDILFNQKAGENSALKGLFTTQTRKVDIKV